jgi:predicted nuclease with TOPRIM domain
VVDPEASRTLEECLARIRQLEEENAHLREAAKTFGDLAERLKRALDSELRAGGSAASTTDL